MHAAVTLSPIMRLSSSSSSKRNPAVLGAAVLACIFLLLVPLVAGIKEPEIDLKTANHDRSQDHRAAEDAYHARFTSPSRQHGSERPMRNKPNKSYAKKYIDDNAGDLHHGKQGKSIYDKKYFDYLPAERKVPFESTTAGASFTKRTNSRRLRRDTENIAAQPRIKRQGYTYAPRGFQVWQPMVYPNTAIFQYDQNHRPQLYNQYLPPVVHPISPPPSSNQIPNRTYLPPGTPQFTTGNRIGEGHVFAFDTVYNPSIDTNYVLYPGPRPSNGGGQGQSFIPGRPAFPPVTTTVRPLPPGTTTSTASTITTTTPRPVIQNNSDDDYDWASLGLSPDDLGSRIGADENNLNSRPRTAPSKCTWAIANCCSQFSDKIRYHCFEQNQCYGAFWGDNVCRKYYKLALTDIENYYNGL